MWKIFYFCEKLNTYVNKIIGFWCFSYWQIWTVKQLYKLLKSESISDKLATAKTPSYGVYKTAVKCRESNQQRLTRNDAEKTFNVIN